MIKWKYGRTQGINFQPKELNKQVLWNNFLAYDDGARVFIEL